MLTPQSQDCYSRCHFSSAKNKKGLSTGSWAGHMAGKVAQSSLQEFKASWGG